MAGLASFVFFSLQSSFMKVNSVYDLYSSRIIVAYPKMMGKNEKKKMKRFVRFKGINMKEAEETFSQLLLRE